MFDRETAFRQEDLFGGTGVVWVWDLAGGDPGLPPFQAVLACELEPGALVGPHVQLGLAELVVSLSGLGGVSVEGDTFMHMQPGQVLRLIPGQMLSLHNPSDAPWRYLILKATAEMPADAALTAPPTVVVVDDAPAPAYPEPAAPVPAPPPTVS